MPSTDVTLHDGSRAVVRPVRPGDKARVEAGFERLSPESRYRRFLAPMTRLSAETLRYLTEIDHHDHEALLALDERDRAVGVARYVRSPADPASAEAAVTVADDWQGRGLGTTLTTLLADRARTEGVERFTAVMLAENRDMLEVLEEVGPVRVIARDAGTLEVEAALPPEGMGEHAREMLRGAAGGRVEVRPPVGTRQGASLRDEAPVYHQGMPGHE